MSEKIKVEYRITERVDYCGTAEMTREEYDEWCDKLDNARGGMRDHVAGELAEFLAIDFARDGNPIDMEVDDFCEV